MTSSSFFTSIFCCCGQRSKSPDVLDETSRLLPAVEDLPSPDASNIVVVDQQRLRDKWTSIVRAKEGKMVNVNAALPFNLHNQALPHHAHSASASRSRSLSAARNPSSSSRDPYATISRANGMLAPSFSRSKDLPSSSSNTNLRAAAGFETDVGEGGVEGSGVAEEGTGMESHVRSPLLGMRLVNPDGVAVGPSPSASMSGRGRPGWSGPAIGGTRSSNSRGRTEGGGDDEMTPRPSGIVTKPQEIKLNIGDAGAISVSWGD